MAFKDFRIFVFIRIIVLSFTIGISAYLILYTEYYATFIAALFFTIVQIGLLVNFLDKTNKDVAKFLNSIRFDDFSYSFPDDHSGSSFNKLNREFNAVLQKFREVRAEKEAQYHYLKTVIQNVGVGLISFHPNGDVQLSNGAAKKLLRIGSIRHLKDLEVLDEGLPERIDLMNNGDTDLVKIYRGNSELQLAIKATVFKLRKEEFKLVSFQNIQSELEEKEMEAWQNLIRVLTHEIMNSVTPISSLASTVDDTIAAHISDSKNPQLVDPEDLEDVHLAVKTIRKRSESLIKFVSDFRNMTRVPIPTKSIFRVKEMLEHIYRLMKPDLEKAGIKCELKVDPDNIQVNADREQIEQVIINLIKNAQHALEENSKKLIVINSWVDSNSRVFVSVDDNGTGIEKEALERIFIPFFTTKKTGSGIGLSLSRQIMRMHKGNITAISEPGKTRFTLKF
jgi:nitrogen fixation/metabolism regulation signal transduction histidine kinase